MFNSENHVPTKYYSARIVLAFLSLVGWLLLIAGGVLFAMAIGGMSGGGNYSNYGQPSFNMQTLFLLGPSLTLLFAGLFALANVELTRAAIDSADINREMLLMMREAERRSSPKRS